MKFSVLIKPNPTLRVLAQVKAHRKKRDDLKKEAVDAVSDVTKIVLSDVNDGVAQVIHFHFFCRSDPRPHPLFERRDRSWVVSACSSLCALCDVVDIL